MRHSILASLTAVMIAAGATAAAPGLSSQAYQPGTRGPVIQTVAPAPVPGAVLVRA